MLYNRGLKRACLKLCPAATICYQVEILKEYRLNLLIMFLIFLLLDQFFLGQRFINTSKNLFLIIIMFSERKKVISFQK